MKCKTLITLCLLTFPCFSAFSQFYYPQFFDGADTIPTQATIIQLDPDTNNIWQVGPPQKVIFNAPFSTPNVLVTDTVNAYPLNNQSVFTFPVADQFGGFFPGNIIALQWMQKLDMHPQHGMGFIEFSNDNGTTWQEAFNNPYVYNFYGYQTTNVDTSLSGRTGFTGMDSTWRNIWLCIDGNWVYPNDTMMVRFTFASDSAEQRGEGWMIDNLIATVTFQHTLTDSNPDFISIYPTVTTGLVNIEANRQDPGNEIQSIEVYDASGRSVRQYGRTPSKFFVDLKGLEAGTYFLRVRTSVRVKTTPIILER
jgi:hypothetical protein